MAEQLTRGVEFIKPLVDDMVQDDPSKRPSIDQVVDRYDKMVRTLPWWKLHSRLVELDEKDFLFESILRPVHHFFRTAAHILRFRNPIPRPRP